ncbi:MAG TPA: hypothetical protein PKD25_16895, partial [Rubrivivax sp.]|nr:hypothetical protein [Rubrivivax sp.]
PGRQPGRGVPRNREAETYTWDVLPEPLRREPVTAAVAREIEWVLAELQAGRGERCRPGGRADGATDRAASTDPPAARTA